MEIRREGYCRSWATQTVRETRVFSFCGALVLNRCDSLSNVPTPWDIRSTGEERHRDPVSGSSGWSCGRHVSLRMVLDLESTVSSGFMAHAARCARLVLSDRSLPQSTPSERWFVVFLWRECRCDSTWCLPKERQVDSERLRCSDTREAQRQTDDMQRKYNG